LTIATILNRYNTICSFAHKSKAQFHFL